jgi:hypothetical protein
MPVRGAVTRRSLDTNAPERKSGRAAFKSARSMFEHQHPQEHGDEQYGNTVYSASIGSLPDEDRTTDDSSNTKSINDLIKVNIYNMFLMENMIVFFAVSFA